VYTSSKNELFYLIARNMIVYISEYNLAFRFLRIGSRISLYYCIYL